MVWCELECKQFNVMLRTNQLFTVLLQHERHHIQQLPYTFRINRYRIMKPALIVYLVDTKKKLARKENESKHAIKELKKQCAATF